MGSKKIGKLLVANRGEIAVRIFRACRELGIATVAVYSDVDRDAVHVRTADEAFHIGPTPPGESYLRIDKILETAQRAGADAIHPGYGFLSENMDFARAVTDSAIIWVGPPPEAVEAVGDKVSARKVATAAGVSGVPGTMEPISGPEEIEKFAADHGWPVALKAAFGGGGRGFRVVNKPEEAQQAFEGAGREAQVAFGNPALYLERYLPNPRHIEIQVIGDKHGNVIHLGERDCSLQRRHQKLIEESPSPVVDDALRAAMGEAAVKVCRQAGYHSAGTVEFLFENTDDGPRFYFLEVNTRLQVEHPVTELVAGIDLVKEMIRVAEGEPLSLTQEQVTLRGHAIECRINAENPAKGFLPNPGTLTVYQEPGGPGVRVDSGSVEGSQIPQAYDSLIAKLICYGRDRGEAIDRTRRALEEFRIEGLRTTIPFHLLAMESDWFRSGEFDTKTVETKLDLKSLKVDPGRTATADQPPVRSVVIELDDKRFEVSFTEKSQAPKRKPKAPDLTRTKRVPGGGEAVTAPMQGTIVKTLVSVGDKVTAGQAVAVLEAMKMENMLSASSDGVVKEISVKPGDSVQSGSPIAVIAPE